MNDIILCSKCGEPAWQEHESFDGVVEVAGKRQPLAIASGEALCRQCWSEYWHEISLSHVGTFLRDYRTLPDDIAFDDEARSAYQLGGYFSAIEPYDFESWTMCRDCFEELIPPGEVLCSMCEFDHQRKA